MVLCLMREYFRVCLTGLAHMHRMWMTGGIPPGWCHPQRDSRDPVAPLKATRKTIRPPPLPDSLSPETLQ